MFGISNLHSLKRIFIAALLLLIATSSKCSSTSNRYDKSISLFSPEGELLQIKYADKVGANGLSLICVITSDNSIVLCSPSAPAHSLLDRRCVDKVSQVDEGIWIAFAGLLGDGRHVTRKARQFCNDYHVKFGCRPAVRALARHIGSLQHESSVKGGERPLGLHVLCAGFDEGPIGTGEITSSEAAGGKGKAGGIPAIFMTRASGEVTQWKAVAIGKHAEKALSSLEDRIGPSISEVDAIRASVEVLSRLCSSDSKPDGDAEATFDTYVLEYGQNINTGKKNNNGNNWNVGQHGQLPRKILMTKTLKGVQNRAC